MSSEMQPTEGRGGPNNSIDATDNAAPAQSAAHRDATGVPQG